MRRARSCDRNFAADLSQRDWLPDYDHASVPAA